MKELFLLLLASALPWRALCQNATCTDHPFDIATTLIPKKHAQLDCDEEETLYIAKLIANTVNYVVVKTLNKIGVTHSKTRVCKDGEFLHEGSHSALLLRGRRSLRQRRFIFRGSGSCTRCFSDNYDQRKLLEESDGLDFPIEMMEDEVLWNETIHATSIDGDGGDIGSNNTLYLDNHRHLSTRSREKQQIIHKKSIMKLAKLDDTDLNDFRIIQGYKKPKVDEELDLHWNSSLITRRRNGFGLKNIHQKRGHSIELGVFRKGFVEAYYYNYLRNDLSFNALQKIMQIILRYVLIRSKENKNLCTYRKLHFVRVRIKSAPKFVEPVCQADTG